MPSLPLRAADKFSADLMLWGAFVLTLSEVAAAAAAAPRCGVSPVA